jgi:hypothetical protein
MKTGDWIILYGVIGFIDLAQFLLDLIPVVGEVINALLDPVIGFCLGWYFQIKGVSMANPSRLLGLIAFFLAEEATVSALPLWILDVAYTHITVVVQNRIAKKHPKIMGALNKIGEEADISYSLHQPLNQNGIRQPNPSTRQPLNTDGIRSPQQLE